jgi:multidrug efflux pump subunit AcrA (membrane-fusion protein)
MSELQSPVEEKTATEPKKKAPATHEQKQKRRKRIRRIVTWVVVIAMIAAAVVLLRSFLLSSGESGLGEPMDATVMRGSIQSTVSGMGNARAKTSATVTPDAGSKVLELFVSEGDYVEEGQLLYNLDDSAAQEAVQTAQDSIRKAQETVDDYNTELNKLYANVANLTITAPHDGKLMDVNTDIKVGADLSEGTAVATVVNDTKLRLHLYYSWAYEGQITVGQAARVSLPVTMSDYPATVEQVNYVRRVVPEGSVVFEVVFVMDNPGTLTEGMTASASLTGADGTAIYPYQSGTLEYYETTKVTVKVAGPVLSAHLMNYADVTAGQVLVQLGDTDASAEIASKQNSLREAQKVVDSAVETYNEAVAKLDNYHASSPISGRVLTCDLTLGEEVPSGASIYIADTATMMIDINIDERNIGYVSNGMWVDIQDMTGNYYTGVIDQVSLTAKAENGVASFPATVVVDNPDGLLMTGSYVDYTFVASQSSDCLVVPIQAVKTVTLSGDSAGGDMDDSFDEDGEIIEDQAVPGASSAIMVDSSYSTSALGPSAFQNSGTATVCYVKGEPDDRAIEADESWNVPDGYFVVPVETGLSDENNVEIKSGLYEFEDVFLAYTTNSAYGWD